MTLFFFDNNFKKKRETFKIFSPQLLEVYTILLVETTLESIMFYCTFSVTNTTIPQLYWAFLAGIDLISLLMMSFLVRGLFSKTVFQVRPQKTVKRVEIVGLVWPGVIGLIRNESVPWEVMAEVFKCSV